MIYDLPKTAEIKGKELEIRCDFRVILTILEIMGDAELSNMDKATSVLELFYVHPEEIEDASEAINKCFEFIDCGQKKSKKKAPRVMDWEQDFNYIIAPVNRVLGYEARGVEYDFDSNTGGLHWWTFMGAYMEIGGDCLFSQMVNIREKLATGKKLEKYEKDWHRRNADIIQLKTKMTDAESALADDWMGVKHG